MNAENANESVQSKEGVKFAKNMKKLIALFRGEALLQEQKVGKDDLSNVLDELSKEEKQALFNDFKAKAKQLIKRKQEFDKFVKAEKAKFEKAVEDKQKEFNKEMEGIFGIVEKIQTIENDYYTALKDLSSPKLEATAEEVNEELPE